MDERERREQPMERGHRAQWASGEPPAKPSGLKRARPTTHGNFLNRLLRGLKRARPTTNGNFLNRLVMGRSILTAMAKIRHIAIRAEDVEKTAAFFQTAFGLQFVQRRGSG